MKFVNLASSSSGNCYYIELDRKDLPPVKLMLEVGLSYKDILRKCLENGIEFNSIDAFLITHNHKDHSRAAADLLCRNKDVFSGSGVLPSGHKNMLKSGMNKVISINTYTYPFVVEHDALDSLGYVIQTDMEKILFVNDCKYFKASLSHIHFDYIFIESNYDGQAIHFAYDHAKREHNINDIKRYERLLNSHMSLANCVTHLKRLNLEDTKAIFLMHLSDRHANENIFKNRVAIDTKVKTFVCKKNGGIL